MKQFHFLCGLPRSGSTVLASILGQNPALYASPNSPLVELLVNVRNHLRITEQARAFMQPGQERDVLIGIMEGMYAFTSAPRIIDKSRAWPHPENINLLKDILPQPPKFIVTVRSLPAVLASFITLIEKHPESQSFVDKGLAARGLALTMENRCEALFSPDGTVWEAWQSLKMGFDAGFSPFFHFVEYDELVARPCEVLAGIYEFLDIPLYEHDLRRIENKTPEDDGVYDLPGMHNVRPVLGKVSPDPAAVLGPTLAARYAAVPHFWRAPAAARSARNPFSLNL